MIYLLTAVGLSPGDSTHLHTNNTENNTNNNRTTQITNNVEECGPCPTFASFTLAFSLQLRKKHGKTSVRVRKISVRLIKTSVRVQKCFRQICRGNQSTYFVFSTFFSENRAVYRIMWENIVELDRPQMTIWHMHIACWRLQTHTHSM